MAKAPLVGEEVKTPEVYRSTPYEYMLTVDPPQHGLTLTCTRRLPVAGVRLTTKGRLVREPALPNWMTTR